MANPYRHLSTGLSELAQLRQAMERHDLTLALSLLGRIEDLAADDVFGTFITAGFDDPNLPANPQVAEVLLIALAQGADPYAIHTRHGTTTTALGWALAHGHAALADALLARPDAAVLAQAEVVTSGRSRPIPHHLVAHHRWDSLAQWQQAHLPWPVAADGAQPWEALGFLAPARAHHFRDLLHPLARLGLYPANATELAAGLARRGPPLRDQQHQHQVLLTQLTEQLTATDLEPLRAGQVITACLTAVPAIRQGRQLGLPRDLTGWLKTAPAAAWLTPYPVDHLPRRGTWTVASALAWAIAHQGPPRQDAPSRGTGTAVSAQPLDAILGALPATDPCWQTPIVTRTIHGQDYPLTLNHLRQAVAMDADLWQSKHPWADPLPPTHVPTGMDVRTVVNAWVAMAPLAVESRRQQWAALFFELLINPVERTPASTPSDRYHAQVYRWPVTTRLNLALAGLAAGMNVPVQPDHADLGELLDAHYHAGGAPLTAAQAKTLRHRWLNPRLHPAVRDESDPHDAGVDESLVVGRSWSHWVHAGQDPAQVLGALGVPLTDDDDAAWQTLLTPQAAAQLHAIRRQVTLAAQPAPPTHRRRFRS